MNRAFTLSFVLQMKGCYWLLCLYNHFNRTHGGHSYRQYNTFFQPFIMSLPKPVGIYFSAEAGNKKYTEIFQTEVILH